MNVLSQVLVLLGLLVAIVGVVYQRRALFPLKREITITALPPVPMLSDSSSSLSDIRILLDEREISDPHMVTVTLTNTGRHDVVKGSFHDEEPLRIDFGSEIVRLTTAKQKPPHLPVRIAGTQLELGPGHFRRGAEMTLQVLSGGRPELEQLKSKVSGVLVDVDLTFRPAGRFTRPKARLLVLIASVAAGLLGAGLMSAVVEGLDEGSFRLVPSHGAAGEQITVSGEGYEPHAVIEVQMDEVAVGEDQADADGEFDLKLTVPAEFDQGYVDVRVSSEGKRGTHYQYSDFAVTD